MIAVSRHTNVWLVRHAQTDWNKARRYQSRSDRPLTEFGSMRSAAVAHRLRRIRFNTIITCGQRRTDDLAQAIAAQQEHRPRIEHDERWREADHGVWEGLTYAEVGAQYQAQARERFADPWYSRAHGGESTGDVWARVEAGWDAVLQQHTGEHILIVTHATPIQLLLCALLKLSFEQYWQWRLDLGGITGIDLYPSGAIMRVINEVPPLVGRT
jgi:2,3-bisphosphoglycerate-dependent phosphoglycerate mutase/probable phosphoglycerate mutase